MEKLEQTLAEVKRLEEDLSAEIVLGFSEETIEVWKEEFGDSSWNYGCPTGKTYLTTETIEIPIKEPDAKKREDARQGLQKIYDSSEWYFARYAAGRVLTIEETRIKSDLEKWLDILCKDARLNWGYNAPITRGCTPDFQPDNGEEFVITDKEAYSKVNKAKKDLRIFYRVLRSKENLSKIGEALDIPKPKTLSDIILSRRHLDFNHEELETIYSYGYGKARVEAGKALGYSPLRIWAHENPASATISGIAAAGAASGLGYFLYQYLSR